MDLPTTNADVMDQHKIDLEKGVPSESTEPLSTSAPSPTATSSTAVSKSLWADSLHESKLGQLGQKLLSYLRRSNPDGEEEEEIPGIIIRTLESCPKGYPNLAAFLDSDENFMLYRRFGYIQSRLLLHKQDELRALEEKLDLLDKRDDTDPETQRFLQSRDLDDKSGGPRKELLQTIETKFKEYAELLKIAQTLVAFNKPAPRDYTSVKNYFENDPPLNSEDEYYIYRREDMITLKPGRENAWLDGTIERVLQKLTCSPIRYLFQSAETRAKTKGTTVYYTKSRIDTLVTLIITFIILVLLVIPVYLLWHLCIVSQSGPNTPITIGILLVFTLVFSAVLSFFTRARRHEIFGAAAAYCAVLVVFISNVGQGAYSLHN